MKNNSHGFSLIEFLIAMAVGSTIITGVITLYLTQLKTYQYSQNLERMQENARIASQKISKDLKMVGLIGCGRLSEINLENPLHLEFNSATSLVGFQDGYSTSRYSSAVLTSVLHSALPSTDQILIQEVNSELVPAKTENSVIKIFSNINFKEGNILLLSNCNNATLFKLDHLQKNILTPSQPLTKNYHEIDSQIGRFLAIVYYLAETGRKNSAGNPIIGLYRRDLMGAATKQNELIENVENMQIRYGIVDKPGDSLHYFTASQVKYWQKVRLVQIDLLLVSPDAICTAPQNYRFMNQVKMAPDRRLRREWNIFVTLRER